MRHSCSELVSRQCQTTLGDHVSKLARLHSFKGRLFCTETIAAKDAYFDVYLITLGSPEVILYYSGSSRLVGRYLDGT